MHAPPEQRERPRKGLALLPILGYLRVFSVGRDVPIAPHYYAEHAVVEVRYRATRRMADYGRAGVSGERGDSALTVVRRSGFATLDKIRIMAKRA